MSFESSFEALREHRRLDLRQQRLFYDELTLLAKARLPDRSFRDDAINDVLDKLLSLAKTGGLDEVAHPRAYVVTMLKNHQRDSMRRERRVRRGERAIVAESEGVESERVVPSMEEEVDLTRVTTERGFEIVRAWLGDLVDGAVEGKRGSSEGLRETVDEIVKLAFDEVRTEELAARHGLVPDATERDRKRIVNNLHQRHHRARTLLLREVQRRLEDGLIDRETHERWTEGLEALRRCQSSAGTDVPSGEDGAR